MTTPDTKNGITKDSTLQISVNPYFPNNYQQILNHVGFWKWNPTLSQFDEGSQNDYNLLVQPLWFDAESGLPQKIRIGSGDTKRLKLENENQDRSSEVVDYIEPTPNNLMVRFNTKTRSVTEYPYFEVEGVPPTISTPITTNGYYKFDGNTLIPGTNQDYNIYINVAISLPEYDVRKFNFTALGVNTPSSGIGSNTYYYRHFNSKNSVKKVTDNSITDACYVYQNGDTIILGFGKAPIGSYYTKNGSQTSCDSISGEFVKYNNTTIMSRYIMKFYNESNGTSSTSCFMYLFGKLTNTPS